MIDTAHKSVCTCPFNGGICIDGVRDDFKDDSNGRKIRCRLWQHLTGKDPQSEKMIDQWDCAIAWLPITTIETAQMERQTGASIDKLATGVAEIKSHLSALGGAVRVAAASISQAVEAGALNVMLPSLSPDQPPNGEKKTRELNEGEP